MTTSAHTRAAHSQPGFVHDLVPSRSAPAVSRRQVAIVRALVGALVGGAAVGAVALESSSDETTRAAGRFAAPRIDGASAAKAAPALSFGDAPVVKGARGGTFDDPVVRKGAGGAPVR
jgi:hypothetical protein